MLFNKNEKVFSLEGTADVIARTDLRTLWSELFCYLLVTGFYVENDESSPVPFETSMVDNFYIGNSNYHSRIGYLLQKGIEDRFKALSASPSISPIERKVLGYLNGLYGSGYTYRNLSGTHFSTIGANRGFTPEMMTVAKYAGVMYGQLDFAPAEELPALYLSKFGNIHLAKEEKAVVSEPLVKYKQRMENGKPISALWSYVSAVVPINKYVDYPINTLVGNLADLALMTSDWQWTNAITIPRYVAALQVQDMLQMDGGHRGPLTAQFYQEFLYGRSGRISLINHDVFSYILDLMVNKMGITRQDHDWTTSIYRRVADSSTIYGKTTRRSGILEYALEALDPDLASDKKKPKVPAQKGEDPADSAVDEPLEGDPETDDANADPVDGEPEDEQTPPMVPSSDPMQDSKNTIGLISFDKTGEGVDEDLYRSAVVVLNDRLQEDDSIPVSADVKAALNQWVNGYLYRTAITATKDQISSLGLQKYLKVVN